MAQFTLPPLKIKSVRDKSEIPWGVNHINAPKVWDTAKGEDVVVAVLDTGCDTTHPDLKDKVLDGRNFTTDYSRNGNNYDDNQGHGTHVAGTIAGVIDGNGVIGVAPEAKLIIGKVLSGDGSGKYGDIVAGINWAINWRGPNGEKTRVISMSLGGPFDIPELYKAIKKAIDSGISVVCASGNNGDGNYRTDEMMYPGAYREVIEVGATNKKDKLAYFSNTNKSIDCAAPGVDIVSTIPNGKWAKMSGTSMSTPHVAGAIALLISAFETEEKRLSEMEIYELLLKHIRPSTLAKNAVGNGIVDLSFFEAIKNPIDEQVSGKIELYDGKYYVNVGPYKSKEEAEIAIGEIEEKTDIFS